MATFRSDYAQGDDWMSVPRNLAVVHVSERRSRSCSRACTTCHMIKRKSDFPLQTSATHPSTKCRGCLLLADEEEDSRTSSEEMIEGGEVIIDGPLLPSPSWNRESSMPAEESMTLRQSATSPSQGRSMKSSFRILRPKSHANPAQPTFVLASDGAELV
jgi:hypothetical protein